MKILARVFLFAVPLIAILPLFAQESVPDAVGKLFPGKPQIKGGGFPGRELDDLKIRLQDVSLALTAPLLPPRGFDVLTQAQVSLEKENTDPLRAPVTAVVTAGLRRYLREDGAVSREKEPSDSLTIYCNTLERLVSRQAYLRDEFGPIYLAPVQVGKVGEYPVYGSPDNTTSTIVAVAGQGKPLLLPVTAERVLRARIADARRLLDEIAKANSPGAATALTQTRQRVQALEAELASLPAQERNGPAFVGPGERPSGLSDPASPGARALVSPNPALFDRSQPASTLFVLTYEHSGIYGDKPFLEDARRRTDWGRLAALVH